MSADHQPRSQSPSAAGRGKSGGQLAFVVCFLALSRGHAAQIARPTSLALAPDGSRLFVVLGEADRLLAVSTIDGAVVAMAPTGVAPAAVAVVPGGNEVWTVNQFSRAIDVFNAETLARIGSVSVPLWCARIAVAPDGARVYVSNAAERSVLVIDVAARAVVARIALAGSMPRDVLLDAENHRLYVAQFLSESVAIVDTDTLGVVAVEPVGALPSGMAVVGGAVVIGHLGLSGSTFDDAITNRVSTIDRLTHAVGGGFELPYATPRAAVADGAGAAWVACFGSDRIVKVDLSSGTVLATVAVGPNPVDLVRHPDGRLFVLNQLGDSITVVTNGSASATWALNPAYPGLTTAALRGERVFNFASGNGPNTCYSCHPDGQVDGLSRFIAPPNYLGSTVINTLPLRFVRWTPPYRRTGSVPTLGLHIANILPILREGAPVSDQEVTDLVAYLNTLGPEPNPFARKPESLSKLERAGRQVFVSMHCAECHAPTLYTDRKVHPVGTGGDADTPTLLNLWQTGPYLHDGRAATLADVFAPLPGRHTPAIVSAASRQALAAYLLTLPNPQVFWSLPTHLAADGAAEARADVQVFDAGTGRARSGATVLIEQTAGPAGITIVQPLPTNAYGEAAGTIRGTTAGIAQFRLRLEGLVATEERPLELFSSATAFVNVAGGAGVDFVVPPNAYPRAVAIGDYDSDGLPDIFVAVSGKNPNAGPGNGAHVGSPSFLLHNRGNGTFEDVTVAAGLYRTDRSSAGAAFGDFDNDGDLDLYVANRGAVNAPAAINELFRNNGNGTFTNVAGPADVANPGFGYSVLWFDYDHDGALDLYVENLTVCCAEGNTTPDALYRNNGDGTFVNVTDAAGLSFVAALGGDGGAVGDYDNDGWQDVLKIAVDDPYYRYYLLRNQGDGAFSDQWAQSGLGQVSSSRGLVFGDYDNDLDLDVFVVGRGLFRNHGNRTFTDVTPQIGFDFGPYAGRRFGHTFVDLNNDGFLDIVAENRNSKLAIFLNQGGTGRFDVLEDVDVVLDQAADPRVGLGVLDYDMDGDMDIFLAKEGNTYAGGQPQALFENRLQNQNHFINVTLVGTDPHTPRSANGARIIGESLGRVQMREIMAGENASGCADYTQHIGLWRAAAVDRLTVRWPSGQQDVYLNIPANQSIRITEGQSTWTTLRTWFDVDIHADVLTGTAPLTVQFSSTVLHASGEVVYLWDFGDGTFGIGPSPTHTFAGTVTCLQRAVTLTARDAANHIATASATITLRQGVAGDFDGDGGVNLADFASFDACLSGPMADATGCPCAPADFDGDGDADRGDFRALQASFAAP